MNYFVTGSAGFIGSNLVDRLLADGHSQQDKRNLLRPRKDLEQNTIATFYVLDGM